MMHILITVPLFRLLILFLLFLGADRLCMQTSGYLRMAICSLLGAVYTALCLLPGLDWIGNLLIYHLVLLAISLGYFGLQIKAAVIFVFLNLLLDGLVNRHPTSLSVVLFTTGAVGLIIVLMMKGKNLLLPVTLRLKNKTLSLYALYDTGNTLKDPATGISVLVVSPLVAKEMVGLTKDQLKHPVESIGLFPGLRLIPYKTVGCCSGFMLGMHIQEVRVRNKKVKRVVAFAPEGFEECGKYQALVGGVL